MNWTTPLTWIGVVWICVHVNYIAAAELLQPQKEPTLGELKVFIAREFRRIDERFQRIDERFNQVDGRFDRIETRLDKIEVGLEKIDDDIRGNGKDGLNVRIVRLESIRNWAIWIIPLTVIPIVTAFLSALFVHYFSNLEKRRKAELSG